ncbi:hypothetical protein BJX99DRAFT_69680 [Aspergillus californicus]
MASCYSKMTFRGERRIEKNHHVPDPGFSAAMNTTKVLRARDTSDTNPSLRAKYNKMGVRPLFSTSATREATIHHGCLPSSTVESFKLSQRKFHYQILAGRRVHLKSRHSAISWSLSRQPPEYALPWISPAGS